mmetsp:Transcript_29918/g.62953  ORF Transcript_29918/g.62953 Transcript_29918/m.62953 type:complete len:362 (+) Transcript_29918:171-1256(+)
MAPKLKLIQRRVEKARFLNWTSAPSYLLPHGLVGLLSIFIGTHLVYCSLTGNLSPYAGPLYQAELNGHDEYMHKIPYRVLIYAISTAMNALSGYQLVRSAPKDAQPLFRKCAVLQMSICYFILRFMPHTSYLLHRKIIETNDVDFRAHGNQCGGGDNGVQNWELDNHICVFVQGLDIIVTIIAIICALSFLGFAIDAKNKNNNNPIIGYAVAFGAFAVLLPFAYPVQLSLYGQIPWWTCIQQRYPFQSIAVVAYIYIPTSLTFSSILFGATLLHRKVISENELGIASIIVISSCFVSCVLMQEIHLPNVSTQRVYLPCMDPSFGEEEQFWEQWVWEALDFSSHSRFVWSNIFGVNIIRGFN